MAIVQSLKLSYSATILIGNSTYDSKIEDFFDKHFNWKSSLHRTKPHLSGDSAAVVKIWTVPGMMIPSVVLLRLSEQGQGRKEGTNEGIPCFLELFCRHGKANQASDLLLNWF